MSMGNMGDMLSSGLDNFIGNRQHAVILVYDEREALKNVEKQGEASTGNKLLDYGKKLLQGDAPPTGLVDASSVPVKSYSVQFNPASLRITAHNDQNRHAQVNTGAENAPETVSGTSVTPSVDLHVNLVFDRVNLQDAFIGDALSTFTSVQAASNLATGIAKLAGKGEQWSVQPPVEAFIAALRNRMTRSVTFVWNQFSFNGTLQTIKADYTMFSKSGRPIRAKVAMRIRQAMNEKNQRFWTDSFDKAFGADGSLSFGKLF